MKPICFAFHEKDYKSFKRHLSPLRSASRHNKAVTRRTIPNDYFCSASRRKIRGKGVFVASPFSSPFSFSEEVIRPVICPGLSRSAFPIERKRRDSGTKRGCCPGCCPGWDNGFSGDCGRCCPSFVPGGTLKPGGTDPMFSGLFLVPGKTHVFRGIAGDAVPVAIILSPRPSGLSP